MIKQTSLIVAVLLPMMLCFDMCSTVQFPDYSFDISGVANQTIELSGMSGLIKFYNCYPDTCNNSNYPSPTSAMNQQKAFLLQIIAGTCTPMSINTTTFQNYNYIDSASFSTGLKINFYPYIQTEQITNNQTTFINQTIYQSSLLVYCNSQTEKPSICKESQSPSTNYTRNGKNYQSTTIEMTCSLYASGGCPQLTLNNFWKFLMDNKIWFAIVIWIISLFQFFLGYFVIRLTILVYGMMTGAVLGIILSAQNYENFFDKNDSNGIIIFIILLSFLMGITFGLALLTMPKVGYVNIGFWDATIFSLLLQNSILYRTGSMTGFYITLGISGFIMAGISLLGFRKFIIVSTAFISSFWIIRTLGLFLPYYPNQLSNSKLFQVNQSTSWQFFLYLISIIILTVLGCVFQFCFYKKKATDRGNQGYYLQDDQSIVNKFKKLLEFKDIKDILKAGKDQVMFLKNLVAKSESSENVPYQEYEEKKLEKGKKPQFIQMAKITKSKFPNIEIQSEQEEPSPKKEKKSKSKKDQKKLDSKAKENPDSSKIKSRQKPKPEPKNPYEVSISNSEQEQPDESFKKIVVKSKKQKQ